MLMGTYDSQYDGLVWLVSWPSLLLWSMIVTIGITSSVLYFVNVSYTFDKLLNQYIVEQQSIFRARTITGELTDLTGMMFLQPEKLKFLLVLEQIEYKWKRVSKVDIYHANYFPAVALTIVRTDLWSQSPVLEKTLVVGMGFNQS